MFVVEYHLIIISPVLKVVFWKLAIIVNFKKNLEEANNLIEITELF